MSFKVKIIALGASVLVLLAGILPLVTPAYAAGPSELDSKVYSPAFQGSTPEAQGDGNLPRYSMGEIPDQAVWHGSSCQFLLHWDETPSISFNATANPQPIGGLTLEPSSPPDWHFSYTPDLEDKRPFTVTITATSGGVSASQSFAITPMPKLAPEQTVFRTGEHTKPGPFVPQDIHYTTENVSIYFEFNYRKPESEKPVAVRKVTVVGDTVVFKEGENVYNNFNDQEDIQQMTVYAEKLVIGSPLHLPQTNVIIRARELRFEGDTAKIITTPIPYPTPPNNATQNSIDPGTWKPNDDGQYATDGAHGLKAGDIELDIQNFYTDNETIKRFDLRGGDGQAGGEGAPGKDGYGYKIGQFKYLQNSLPSSKFFAYDYDYHPAFTLFDFREKGNYKAPPGYLVTYYELWDNCLAGIPIPFPDHHKLGSKKWPGDGSNARPSGWPGLGGDAGNVTSNYDVSAYAENAGGQAGAPGSPYPGGAPGWPPKSIQVKGLGCWWPGWHTLGQHTAKAGNPAEARQAKDRPGVPDSRKQEPGFPNGKDGGYNPVESPYSWLHPVLLNQIINRAKDDYLSDRINQAEAVLEAYVAILAEYKNHPSWNEPQVLSETDRFELEQMYDEMQILLHRIESGLDYFGNPPGWVPMLSFEVNYQAFANEIDRAMRQLYLAYWIKAKHDQEEAQVKALTDARDALRKELKQAQDDYEDAIKNMPILQNEAIRLQDQTVELQRKLQQKEAELVKEAEENMMPRRQIRALLGVTGGCLKLGGLIVSMIPVGQPATAAIGSGMTLLSNFDPQKPWDTIIGGADITNTYVQTKFDKSSRDVFDKAKKVEHEWVEYKNQEYLRAMTKSTAALSTGLADMRGFFSKFEVPQGEVDAELARLKSRSVEFKGLIEDIEDLLEQKKEFAQELVATMQKVPSLSNFITHSILAIDAMNRDITEGEAVLNERVVMYLDNMERRAYERLLEFHYYMAKAYEYRLLEPYTEPLDFRPLIEECQRLAGKDDEITPTEHESLKAVYEKTLSEIAQTILGKYNKNASESSYPVPVSLSPEEKEDLNAGKPVTINLMEKGLFPLNEENIRIFELEVDKLAAHAEGGSPVEGDRVIVTIEHSGLSKLVSDGEIYQFRHYTVGTKNPITWGAVYYPALDETAIQKPTVADYSLISNLLGTKGTPDNVLLYSRPAAWADLVIKKDVHISPDSNINDIVIDSLTLKVTHDYTSTIGNRTVNLQVLTSEAGLMPYFTVGSEDLSKRQDGRGEFLRTYHENPDAMVTLEAPAAYGVWQFEKWTDRQGNDLGDDPTNPILQLKLDDDRTVVAQMSQAVEPPTPTPPIPTPPIPTPPTPTPPTPTPMPTPINWALIGGIIGGVIVAGGLAWYLLLRRKRKVKGAV